MKRLFLLSLLLVTALSFAIGQKSVVSKKNPVTPPLNLQDMAGTLPSGDEGSDLIALGDSCMELYDTHGALPYYLQAYHQNPTFETRQKLANCLYQRCDYRQCVTLLSGIPVTSMTHDALRQLFFSYSYLKNEKELVSSGQNLLLRFPMDAEVLARLCTVLCDLDKAGEAVTLARDYYRRDSTNLLVNRILASSLYLDRQFQPAIHHYERLLALGDTTYLALYSLGIAYEYLGDKQQAYRYLLSANDFSSPKKAGCLYRLGMICVDLEHYDEGLKYLYSAEGKLQPDKSVMKLIYDSEAQAYYATERYVMAYDTWKQARKLDGTSLAYIYNIGASCVAIYEQAKAKNPEYPEYWGTETPRILQEAIDYFALFLEMAENNGREIDAETQRMINEAHKYIEMYKPNE